MQAESNNAAAILTILNISNTVIKAKKRNKSHTRSTFKKRILPLKGLPFKTS